MIKYYISILIVIITFSDLHSQEKLDFGNVSGKLINSKKHDKFPNANAAVIYDLGKSWVDQQNTMNGIKLYYTRVSRIKIYNDKGLNRATISIDLLKLGDQEEQITHIEGITHNKTGKSHLNKSAIEYVKINNHMSKAIFTMPDAKVGSIIDVKYVVCSPFFFIIPQWYFQNEIPTEYSAYKCVIPEWVNINPNITGDESDIDLKSELREGAISKEQVCVYEMKKIAPFYISDFNPSSRGYASNISFTTKSVNAPGMNGQRFPISWKSLSLHYSSDPTGAKSIEPDEVSANILSLLNLDGKNEYDKANIIYNYITDNYDWNRINSIYRTKTNSELAKSKIGASSDINLLLIQLLKEAGITVNPIIISTTDHGPIDKKFPNIKQLNSVIALLKIGANNINLDATVKKAPFGILPLNDLNGFGLIVKDMYFNSNDLWSTIEPSKSSYMKSYNVGFDENLNIFALTKCKLSGHYAIDAANKYDSKYKDEEVKKYAQKINADNIDHFKINLDGATAKIEYNFLTSGYRIIKGDQLLINPMLFEQRHNPFTNSSRKKPVVFSHIPNDRVMLQYHIPDGYKLDNMPDNIAIKLPNGGGQYVYNITINEDKIMINTSIKINRQIFKVEEYNELKKFFKLIDKKENEKIILKRI